MRSEMKLECGWANDQFITTNNFSCDSFCNKDEGPKEIIRLGRNLILILREANFFYVKFPSSYKVVGL